MEGMFAARTVVRGWARAAQALALLEAVHEAGWLGFLAEPRGLAVLRDFTGLTAGRLEDVLGALAAYDIVERDADVVRLAPAFALLSAGDAPVDLTDMLAHLAMLPRLVRDAVADGPGAPLDEGDALVLAKATAGRVTPVSQEVFRILVDALPEYQVLGEGGRLLDVGCGVGWAMLDLATLFPQGRQVGLELVPEVAAETRRRAEALGVQDRVEVRCQDARTFDEENAFDLSFWAHPFFAESARGGVLKMIFHALKPGGSLLMQELFVPPEPGDEAGARGFALDRLLYRHWGAEFAPSAERLCEEAASAGFERSRIAETGLGRVVVMRRPEVTSA
ncbi:class I SAM-dependent methyltransferase [Actinoallomurus bryophytorum]|uniref:Methyltransferase family protein n=1 Tax=Actinoallomurus bryophytorum TaxID=1490222 RepID=A0A543CNK5_9ACTN|nr:class I SAM-dependent methyltransferase [Actinoallomurus bryophytorum]TQL98688.1 methyltransferase family protein [Actinoallomurus bryophytorum]